LAIENSNSGEQLARQIHDCLEAGDLTRAEKLCRQAENLSAPDLELMLQTGKVHYFCKRFPKAICIFRQVLKEYPGHSEVRIALWACYHDSGDFEHMLEIAAEFESKPLNANELFFAYRSFLAVCDWERAGKLEQQTLALAEQGKLRHDLIQALLLDLCAIPDIPDEQVFRIHCLWGKTEVSGKRALCSGRIQSRQSGERLKIAYLSADFNAHPVGFFMANILNSHDRESFEIYCYAHLGRHDEVSERLRDLTDHFVDITHLNHADAAARIHADGIHILVDLGGHTNDTRMPVLAYRPAPVQMTYLGYPNTTGLPTVDYRITDHHAECEEGTRYVEELLYMPQSFLCYGTIPLQIEQEEPAVLHDKQIRFASFNNVRKLTPQVIEAWSRILKRVPESMLMLKFNNADKPHIRSNLFREFARHGIAGERIELLPFIKDINSHFTQYNEVDIALDTFPYNGTTTTCDALAMGVPVVTFAGKAHVQRVSCSILKNIGFEESITYSVDEYIDKAVKLANNPQGLAVLHQILPTLFRHSILCQPEVFTRQMEDLYRRSWQEKSVALPDDEANIEQPGGTPTKQPEWIFITGMQRSGSTWCYNVVRELCKHHGLGTMIGFVGEGEALDKVLRTTTPDDDRPRIIKFHTPTTLTLDMLQNGEAKAVYSQRDLRDVVVSLMDFNDAPFDYVLSQRLHKLVEHHQSWKQAPNTQGIEYRDILEQPQTGIRRISSWLGIDCSEQLVEKIALACSPEATRKRIEEINNRPAENDSAIHVQKVSETRYFDTDTLLHANHITSGKIGRYKNRINHEQIEALNLLLKDWLIEEGYEPNPDEFDKINEASCSEDIKKGDYQGLLQGDSRAKKSATTS